MALKWTETALRTLESIAKYIARDNPERATLFAGELRAGVDALEVFPGKGHAGRVHGTRELVLHKNYRVIYRVCGDDVEILRIHHASRSVSLVFSEPEL